MGRTIRNLEDGLGGPVGGYSPEVTTPTDPSEEPQPDPDAPGNFVDDTEADEVPEPNEPA